MSKYGKHSEFMSRLAVFADAASELSDCEWPAKTPGYPVYLKSFDEVALDIASWYSRSVVHLNHEYRGCRLKVGQRVLVIEGKDVMSEWVGELDTGSVTRLDEGDKSVFVKLDRHYEALDEWDNQLIWTLDDIWFLYDEQTMEQRKAMTVYDVANYLNDNRYLVRIGERR